MTFRIVLFSFLLSIFSSFLFFSCRIRHNENENIIVGVYRSDTILFHCKKGDQSQELQQILNRNRDIIIKFENDKKYYFSDIVVMHNNNFTLLGNRSTIFPYKRDSNRPIFTFVDSKNIEIRDFDISGGYPNQNVNNYLVKVHTPNNVTKKITIEGVNFFDGNGGGIMIQNIFNRYEHWESGADSVIVVDCKFINFGQQAACAIRGSHKNVFIESCFASDPYGRQFGGHVFDITAEVDINQDCVGNVYVKNVKTEYIRLEGLFFQKIKKLQVDGFYARYTGLDINGNSYINNAIKVDDLGYGNKAIIKNVIVKESGEKAFASVSIEESPGQGQTSGVILDSINVDRLVRLGASGNHAISNSNIYNSELQFLSNYNVANNIKFYNDKLMKSVYFAQFKENKILNSIFFNALIEIGTEAQQVFIENCSLITNLQATYFIAIVLNNPNKPNIVSIKNCFAPENVYGIWSGGVRQASRNIELSVSNLNKNQFLIHDHLIKESKVKYD